MSALNPSGRSAITLLVLGDAHVGKTSLISSLVSESWSDRLPPVLQPVMVPPTLMPEHIQLTIIDTSSEPAHTHEWLMHLRTHSGAAANSAPASSKASLLADAVLLVVAADVPDSFARVESYWLPLLEEHAARTHSIRRPVIIAINKSAHDGADEASSSSSAAGGASSPPDLSMSLDGGVYPPDHGVPTFDHLVRSHRVSCVLPCSAKYLLNLPRLFHACNTVVLAPVDPLFELHSPSPAHPNAPGCMRFKLLTQKALLRIFRLFDADGDGVLSYRELDWLHQVNFKGKRLAARAFDQLMERFAATDREFVRAVGYIASPPHASSSSVPRPVGLTFSGLLHFHALFLERNRHLWHTWTIVHQFGYEIGNTNQQQQQQHQQGAATGTGQHGAALSMGSAAALAAASSSFALPSLGHLVLRPSYAQVGLPFSPLVSYELSTLAVDFLTNLFRKYDADGDGMLQCVRAHSGAAAAAAAVGSNEAGAGAGVVVDAAPSSTCSLSASTDLERMFLTSPDMPFAPAAFAQFVSRAPQQQDAATHVGLDGWLAAWALLLYNYSTVPLSGLPSSSGSNLSASFTSPSSAAAAVSSFVPNPDIVLRYLAYLCFPVTPAMPESSEGAGGQRTFLPQLPRCLHVTPRPFVGGSVDVAHEINEHILCTDPSISPSAPRALTSSDSASQARPRTVVAFVIGSERCGKSAFIDCMLGNAPSSSAASASPLVQQVSAATVAGLAAVLPKDDTVAPAESGASSSVSYPRTYAARLPLAHVPQIAAVTTGGGSTHASAADAASTSGVIDPSLRHASNRFLILKDIPAASASSLLSSPSFTAGAPGSCDLLVLLYDGTSPASLEFARARLQQCFERRLPVMVVQTKADYANCSLAKNDFHLLDFSVRCESFSTRLFWSTVSAARSAQATPGSQPQPQPAVTTLFERIYQAARQPHASVLTSLSSSRRAAARSRWLLSTLGVLASGMGLWMLVRSGAVQFQWPISIAGAAGASESQSAAAGAATTASGRKPTAAAGASS